MSSSASSSSSSASRIPMPAARTIATPRPDLTPRQIALSTARIDAAHSRSASLPDITIGRASSAALPTTDLPVSTASVESATPALVSPSPGSASTAVQPGAESSSPPETAMLRQLNAMNEKMLEYQAEMRSQMEAERRAYEDRCKLLEIKITNLLIQRSANQPVNIAALQDDEEQVRLSPQRSHMVPSLSLVPPAVVQSSSRVEEPSPLFIRCIDCNEHFEPSSPDRSRCLLCEAKLKQRAPGSGSFVYKPPEDSGTPDDSDDEKECHQCIGCGERLNGADNTLRCPVCQKKYMVRYNQPAARAIKADQSPAQQKTASVTEAEAALKTALAAMRATMSAEATSSAAHASSASPAAAPLAKTISRHEQEQRLQKIKIEAEEVTRDSTSSSVDLAEEASSVLGNVLSRVFTS